MKLLHELLKKHNIDHQTEFVNDHFAILIKPLWNYQDYLLFIHNYIELMSSIPLTSEEFVSVIIMTNHPQVLTIGKGKAAKEFNTHPLLDLEVHNIHRGGGLTFHGTGQIICYPLVNLRKLQISMKTVVLDILGKEFSDYFNQLLGEDKIQVKQDPLGLWIENRKLGSIGLGIKKDFILHGLAFNLFDDGIFKKINLVNPCGLNSLTYASLSDYYPDELIHFEIHSQALALNILGRFL